MSTLFKNRQSLNRYEKAVMGVDYGSRIFRSAVSGISRAVRLSNIAKNEHMQTVWDTGANVVGPTFFLFVWWVLENAEKKGIKRLYFLARDGQIMAKIANTIKEYWNYNIECRYLYGSRAAWLPPAIKEIGSFELHWMTWGYLATVSINELCRRINVKPDLINDYLIKYGLNVKDRDINLSEGNMELLKKCLQDGAIQKIIIENQQASFHNTLSYFEQEGLLENIPFAIVDTGWGASSQFALSNILDKAGVRPGRINGFYLGLSEGKQVFRNDKLFSLLFDWTLEPKDNRLSNYLFYEILTAADHGRTIGYKHENGRFSPVLDVPLNDTGIEWGIMVQQKSVVKYAHEFAAHFERDMLDNQAASQILRTILCLFMENPTKREANVYGEYIIGGEITERDFQKFAPRIDPKEFWAVALGRKKFRGFWPTGTLKRSNMPVQKKMWDVFQSFNLLYYYRKYICKY